MAKAQRKSVADAAAELVAATVGDPSVKGPAAKPANVVTFAPADVPSIAKSAGDAIERCADAAARVFEAMVADVRQDADEICSCLQELADDTRRRGQLAVSAIAAFGVKTKAMHDTAIEQRARLESDHVAAQPAGDIDGVRLQAGDAVLVVSGPRGLDDDEMAQLETAITGQRPGALVVREPGE